MQLKFEQNDASSGIAKLDWARMKFAGRAYAWYAIEQILNVATYSKEKQAGIKAKYFSIYFEPYHHNKTLLQKGEATMQKHL